MKIMQIVDGICYHDCTREFPTIQSTVGKFQKDILFVEAPDYVFEGWGYNGEETGDARFIKPECPEGWLYDEETGTYYSESDIPKHMTAAGKREKAYNTETVIAWEGELITVTEASQLWQYYAAEGNTTKTGELTALIAEAKASIREQYQDEEVSV